MKRGFILVIVILLCVASLVQLSPMLASWVGIPSEVRMFPGSELSLNIQVPFSLADANGMNVIGPEREFSFISDSVGTHQYQVRLFGIIPVREMVVDVVPEIAVIPGGHSIGVLLSPNGLVVNQVVPVYGIDGREHFPSSAAGIEPGDIIVSMGGKKVTRPEQVSAIVNDLAQKGKLIEVVVERDGKRLQKRVEPILSKVEQRAGESRTSYLIGVILEDPAAGVGTLSFYEPRTKRYGALGHTITDGLGRQMQIDQGTIVNASIESIKYGLRGYPGEKLGTFQSEQDMMGNIEKNSPFGIFGTLMTAPSNPYFTEPIPVALAHQVKPGPAHIYTVLRGNEIERFDVEIMKVARQTRPGDKGLVIRVTDPRLLRETGGIIQGMSGSPIVQDGMLVGAVTHVFINDPTRGYGNLIEWMVYEAGFDTNLLRQAS